MGCCYDNKNDNNDFEKPKEMVVGDPGFEKVKVYRLPDKYFFQNLKEFGEGFFPLIEYSEKFLREKYEVIGLVDLDISIQNQTEVNVIHKRFYSFYDLYFLVKSENSYKIAELHFNSGMGWFDLNLTEVVDGLPSPTNLSPLFNPYDVVLKVEKSTSLNFDFNIVGGKLAIEKETNNFVFLFFVRENKDIHWNYPKFVFYLGTGKFESLGDEPIIWTSKETYEKSSFIIPRQLIVKEMLPDGLSQRLDWEMEREKRREKREKRDDEKRDSHLFKD